MRLSIAIAVLVWFAAPSFAAPAAPLFGAEGPAESMAETHGHGEKKKGGLDFTGFKRYDLGIYTLIVFGLLLLVLSKFAWPHIAEGLR